MTTINFHKGDKVMVLDDALEGVVTAIIGHKIMIETTDGFELGYLANELIKKHNNQIDLSLKNQSMRAVIQEKEIPKARSFIKEKKSKTEIGIPEFDLHIEKLVKNHKHMTHFDILTHQSDTAKRHLDFAIRNRIPKIVFIHGVGEGVLKAELDFLLGRYENVVFQDANFQKYGTGATEVYFKQKN